MKKVKIPVSAKLIYYKTYALTRTGKVIRVRKAKGATPGRVLSPYGAAPTVHLSYGGEVKQYTIKQLLQRYFR